MRRTFVKTTKNLSGSTEKGMGGFSYAERLSNGLTLRSLVFLLAMQELVDKEQILLDIGKRMVILD